MKILILSDDFPPVSFGGAGIVAENITHGLAGNGHEVFVITTVRKREEEGESLVGGIKIFKIFSNYHERWRGYLCLYNPAVLKKVERIMREIKPDVTHAHNIHYYLSYASLKLAKKYSKAVFLTAHDTQIITYGKVFPRNGVTAYKVSFLDLAKEANKRFNPLRNILIKHYLKKVSKIFCVSNSLKEFLEVNGIKNLEVIHNGIDTSKWAVTEPEVEAFKKEHDIVGKKAVMFGGRLSGSKGGEALVNAMKEVVAKEPNAALLLVGKKDGYAEKIEELFTNIVFTGWVDRAEMKRVFGSSDLVVVPSLYLDPFPTINLEAAACKKPVIGTCFGGTPEIVQDGVTGYIINPNDVKLLAEKILDILQNKEKAEEMGVAAYEIAQKNFTLEKQTNSHLSFYGQFV